MVFFSVFCSMRSNPIRRKTNILFTAIQKFFAEILIGSKKFSPETKSPSKRNISSMDFFTFGSLPKKGEIILPFKSVFFSKMYQMEERKSEQLLSFFQPFDYKQSNSKSEVPEP